MESPVLENFRLAAAFGCEAMEIEILDTPKQDPVPMEIDKWPFDWASVNITGPTGLTELFRGLEIDCANSAPQLTSDAQSPEEPMFISNTELQSLWNPRNHSKISDVDNISDSRQQHLARSVPQHLKKSFPKDPSVVFFDYTESPYNEVYVFPSSHRTITAKPAIPRITLWTELEAQESDLQSKLRVLKQSLPLYHPGIIATTEELAHVCFNRAKYKKAEILYRQVVSARLKTPGTSPLKMLAACMDVVDALREMDKYRQSQTLLLKIMGVLQKLVSPEHELAVKALFKLGLVAKYLEDYEQAEDLFSQVLQIRLGIWGPRYLESSASIADLGELLARMGRIAESEKLLRTSLQLFTEIGGVKEEYVCSSMSDLSWSLTVQQSYEEGESLARQALERSERSLGPLAVTTLSAQYALAWNLKNTGRLSESEKLFQRNYRQRSKALGRKDADTLHAAHTLATVVQELGRMKEAIGLHEEVFRVSVDVLGPTQRSTKNSCVDLGGCYEDQGRYEDAVELYTKFVEKLREEGGDGDPEIMMFEYSINLNQERIWEREGWTSEEEDEIGEGNKSREENESQEDDESYENDDHSVGEVEKVEEDEDVEKSKEIAGAEGVCFEGETLSEEEV
jgi:tetratricopeptide (TPR) repeat protein